MTVCSQDDDWLMVISGISVKLVVVHVSTTVVLSGKYTSGAGSVNRLTPGVSVTKTV